jgi:hypothetical protein
MIFVEEVDIYIPIFYVLLDGKSESIYWNCIQQLITSTDWRMEAATVTCDFESALQSTVASQFRPALIVGCLFRYKQAIRRKLISSKFPPETIHLFLGKDGIELLTVIPIEDIESKGILTIKFSID